MSHIKITHEVPSPPKPFWKMTIPELNKYSQQMIIYDNLRRDVKSDIKQTQKSNIIPNIIHRQQSNIIRNPQHYMTRKRPFNKANNKTNNQTKKKDVKNRRKTSKPNQRKKNIRNTKRRKL